jgi:hypothetical protein
MSDKIFTKVVNLETGLPIMVFRSPTIPPVGAELSYEGKFYEVVGQEWVFEKHNGAMDKLRYVQLNVVQRPA